MSQYSRQEMTLFIACSSKSRTGRGDSIIEKSTWEITSGAGLMSHVSIFTARDDIIHSL